MIDISTRTDDSSSSMMDGNGIAGRPRPNHRTTSIPRRHSSLPIEDLTACNNVSVRSIIDQLGKKLDVGKFGSASGRKTKSRSFQTDTLGQIGTNTKMSPNSRSRSMLISRSDHAVISEQLATIQQQRQFVESSTSSVSETSLRQPLNYEADTSGHSPVGQRRDPVAALSPNSLVSPSSRKRWSSRKINPDDLPPAFRVSLIESTLLGQHKPSEAAERRASTQPGRLPFVKEEKRRPAKLHRAWPPVARKKDQSWLSQSYLLLESSLSDLRSLAKVRSQIGSFEPIAPPGGSSSQNGKSSALGASTSSIVLELDPTKPPQDEGSPLEQKEQNTEDVQNDNNNVPLDDFIDSVPQGLVSALKSGKCKASLRIRWRGPEVFFIEARRRKYFQPLYYDDLLEDRFKQGSDHGLSPLCNDRFGARVSDSCPSHPSRPRRDDWSDYEDEEDEEQNTWDEGQKSSHHKSDRDGSPTTDDELLPSDAPAIWITVYDNEDGETAGLHWRVKRVWDDSILDSREKERIIPDEDLLNTVKNLSGLPAIPAVNLLDDDADNEKNDGNDDDNISLSNWSTKKFYDINGEIVDELQSLERSLDEGGMLDAIVALAKESRRTIGISIPPPPPMESPLQDKWKATTVDDNVDVPVSRAIMPAKELRRDGSISVIESGFDESLSVFEVDDPPSLLPAPSQAEMYKETLSSSTTAVDYRQQNASASSVLAIVASESVDNSHSSSLALDVSTIVTEDIAHKKISDDCDAARVPPPLEEKNLLEDKKEEREDPTTTKSKKKKKEKRHGSIMDLFAPPPVTMFHGSS